MPAAGWVQLLDLTSLNTRAQSSHLDHMGNATVDKTRKIRYMYQV